MIKRKKGEKFILKILLISIIYIILISCFIDSNKKELNYLDSEISLKLGGELTYNEKKVIADDYMDEINDYVSEVNDKGYPDNIINILYNNATNSYESTDIDALEYLAPLIKKRKDEVLEINIFLEELDRNVIRFQNNEKLNTSKYMGNMSDINGLVLKRDYDGAYELAIDVETDLEFIVLEYLFESEMAINELKENGFTTVYVEDLLISSKDSFSGAKTQELLIKVNNRINNTLKKQYALGLIGDLKNRIYKSDFIDYIVILRNTDEIKYKKIQLFEIKDMIDVLEIKIQEYEEEGVDVSEALEIFEESLIYFKEENLDKASSLLVETDTKLESKRVKLTVTDIIAQESLSFLKKYWKRLVIIFLVVVIFSYVFYRKLRIFRLKRRLRNLNIEEGVLIEIIKETQNSRFVEQKMSDSVYDIKMEKYNERLNKVKESVKIVKSVLDKLTKKKRKSSNKKKGLEREKKLKKIFAKVKDKQKEDIKKRKKKHSRNLFKELFKKVPRKKEHLKNVKSKKDFKKKIKANKKLKKRLGWLEKRAPKPKFRKKSKGWRKRKLQIKKRIKIKNKKRRSIPSNKLRSKKKKK